MQRQETEEQTLLRRQQEYEQMQASFNESESVQNQDPMSQASNAYISSGSMQENLVQWQLELDSILERLEHMLRGDKPIWKNGNILWMASNDDSERILNDYGVAEIMRILSVYVNRNQILSNYREETINLKMLDLGNEISDLIFMKYEKMFVISSFQKMFKKIYDIDYDNYFGEFYKLNKDWIFEGLFGKKLIKHNGVDCIKIFDSETKTYTIQRISTEMQKMTRQRAIQIFERSSSQNPELITVEKAIEEQELEKRKLYPMIVREIIDLVHASYLRALHGMERESLRKIMNINQTDNSPNTMGGFVPMQQQRSILNPMRWLGGKN